MLAFILRHSVSSLPRKKQQQKTFKHRDEHIISFDSSLSLSPAHFFSRDCEFDQRNPPRLVLWCGIEAPLPCPQKWFFCLLLLRACETNYVINDGFVTSGGTLGQMCLFWKMTVSSWVSTVSKKNPRILRFNGKWNSKNSNLWRNFKLLDANTTFLDYDESLNSALGAVTP